MQNYYSQMAAQIPLMRDANRQISGGNYLPGIAGDISHIMQPYYQPYISAGTSALPTLQEQLNLLINSPYDVISKFGSQYTASPGYDVSYNQAMRAANQSAAAGGMLGSPMHQQQSATMAQELAKKDYLDYLNNAIGMYYKGLGGMSDISNLGYMSSNELAQSLANAYLTYAKEKAAQKASSTTSWGKLLGTGIATLANFII